MSRTPTMAEVVRAGVASALEGVHTAIPGRVTRYDASKQQADVQPLVKVAREDEEGNRVAESLPVVRNCPVQFPGGGGLVVQFPIAVGDLGMIIFSEASLDKWLSGSGAEVDPDFDVRHGLSDGVFVPGVRPFGAARATNPGSAVCIGTDGGAFQGAALGATLKSFLDEWLTAYLGHTHVSAAPGNPTAAPVSVPPFAPIGVPDIVSDTVKVTP